MDWASIIAVSAAIIFFAVVIYRAMPGPFNMIFRWLGRMFSSMAGKSQEVVGEVTTYG